MNFKSSIAVVAAIVAIAAPLGAQAQVAVSEDFTDALNNNPWYFFNGACLTAAPVTQAGIEPTAGNPGQMPGCTNIGASYYNQPLVGGQNGVAGNVQTLPDPATKGALRFTNGSPGGYSQNGGIVSTNPFPTGQGVSVTFKTVTYRGDSRSIFGGLGDGADGISFYLMDAAALNTTTITGTSAGDGNGLGSWGGSLGYTCSNANPPYNGLIGAYLGLGIDEWGNFLNGVQLMPAYLGPNTATGDNSAFGYGRKPNRIGLRGAGNVAWGWLHTNYPLLYPNTFTPAQQTAAVRNTCRNGVVWDNVANAPYRVAGATVPVYDYAPIPNAYVELPAGTQIANEAALKRGDAIPIFYHLKITQNGLLSLGYSINGGAYTQIIRNQSISASNGPLPANFLFGFAGSTGGSTNIHEILCFKADPATTAENSAGASEKQSAKIETGAQAYFAYYNPSTWTGRVTASGLGLDPLGNVIIAATPNWDGSCTLSGVDVGETCLSTGAVGPTPAQAPTSRVILSWNGSQGIPFEWANLTTAPGGGQQQTIDQGDVPAYNANRLNYLRGDTTNEVNPAGVGLFRARGSVLGDIINSSPIWVGPPIAPYTATWTDRLYPAALMPEAANGVQTYTTFANGPAQTRLNVVYVGANDGLLHGFRSGSYDASGAFVNGGSTPNDGQEVLAYMPGEIVQTIHSTTANIDYANPQYGHQFFVDATPGTGDVFYGGAWHSLLLGGLGAGGKALYALDVTNPTTANFAEGNAANLVLGEWDAATISCANVPGCGTNLGNTYGTPQLRRLHDGKWAAIFGNGLGSASNDGGIFVMTIDPSTAVKTFYYLSTNTGSAGSPNGIAFTSAADLDGDHITDYVYAGDLLGNVWRFDLTSAIEANWRVTPGPLFTTPAGQPISTSLVVASGAPSPGMQQQLMIMFGTGRKVPLTNTNPSTFANGTQSLYGVWDWNLSAWNAMSTARYASLSVAAATAAGLNAGNQTMGQGNLQSQTVTALANGNRDVATSAAVCWAGPPGCAATPQFGWYLNFPVPREQVIFGPQLVGQAITVNSILPAANNPISCVNLIDTGYTYVLNALTGARFNRVFLPPSEAANPLVNSDARYIDVNAIAMQTNATGSSFVVSNNTGTKFLVYETNQTQAGNGNALQGGSLGLNLPPNTTGRRLSWVELR